MTGFPRITRPRRRANNAGLSANAQPTDLAAADLTPGDRTVVDAALAEARGVLASS